MGGISVKMITLLIIGLPQSVLAVLAVQFFTKTKIDIKKFLLISLICAVSTYLFRLLPIAIGVNTVLTLFVIIVSFQFIYRNQLSKVINVIISAVVSFILIVISEVCNMLLLTLIYGGYDEASKLLNSKNGLTQALSGIPADIFFAIFIFVGYYILNKIEARKMKDGETGKETGE
ncbi:hypothetical protein SDC9_69232 [bioreactor metagenome]|uniref:Uncharacterized protein n=1 Tax=bioreactor metagenome TaxID=1076179 RepID=A0A644Y9J5_9ZZZZ